MVYDDDQLRSDQEERRREKFSRERGSEFADRPRRNFGDRPKREFNGLGKRSYRDDDTTTTKKSRYDGALDSYEPQFIRKDAGAFGAAADSSGGGSLLTFKKFLATQDESLSDEEAIAKYTEYKMEFMRKECDTFFKEHKEQEWFRQKYHPEDSKPFREEQQRNLQKRLELFNEFLQGGRLEELALSFEQAERLIRTIDTVVIKLEGGTDEDIEAAMEEPVEDESVMDLKEPAKKEEQQNLGEKMKKEAEEVSGEGTQQKTVPPANTDVEMEAGDNEQKISSSATVKRPQYHKPLSVQFQTVPAAVPLADLENLCKQHPGFVRLYITDPEPDHRTGSQQMRQALATYRWDVNIKEIYWALKSAKLNGADLGVSVNRPFRRRVRTLTGSNLSAHRPIVQNDIRQAAKLIALYDMRAGLFRDEQPEEEAEEGEEQQPKSGVSAPTEGQNQAQLADLEGVVFSSKNPLLSGISEHLIEETSAEEEALLEKVAVVNGTEVMQELEKDEKLLKLLDRFLFYLRIVHSVDFYATTEYRMEDNRPNRLGLFHVRGRPPTDGPQTVRAVPLLPKTIVEATIQNFNERLQSSLMKKVFVPEEELIKLGKRDAEKAVQEFIDTNTVELGPEKWLCPLSGKKFKGAEYVHKHINTKYQEDVVKMRHEALYFNNYLTDPNRPHHPNVFSATVKSQQRQSLGGRGDRDGRSTSPPPRRSSAQHNLAAGVADERGPLANESTEHRGPGGGGFGQRSSWQPMGGGPDRFSGGGGRFSTGGRSSFGAGGRQPRFYEPVNEMMAGGGGARGAAGGGGRDPRAPPSYRDLDAPVDDIV